MIETALFIKNKNRIKNSLTREIWQPKSVSEPQWAEDLTRNQRVPDSISVNDSECFRRIQLEEHFLF